MKQVLVVYYSQSGQLEDIAKSIAQPFSDDEDVKLDFYEIRTVHSFPFPWRGDVFFDIFPETFQQIPEEIHPPPQHILEKKYDLILFHYQVWYLTPSIPINSFLKSPYAATILSGTPVVTVSGSRNMWAKAQDKVKALLVQNGARLVGNIALTDRHHNMISVVTIVDWLFSGIKRRAYGIFPLPGVADQEIRGAFKYGETILSRVKEGNFTGMQESLLAQGAVDYRFFLVSMDKKANRMFQIWSTLILKNPKKRKVLVNCFKYYVVFAIYFLSPIVFLIELLLLPILYFARIKKEKAHYQGI
ncbi:MULTISPECIES: flavodoxin family protein [Sphingobacterium]|uniref:flavodoxin family protein n=1 Tax=Sphingobacterium TaxID=28453 RepID=UPI0013DBF793|nr:MULTISPECIES: dialkylrecorsinol condensing enzyme DarA [unclassified Sphingobacterium]